MVATRSMSSARNGVGHESSVSRLSFVLRMPLVLLRWKIKLHYLAIAVSDFINKNILGHPLAKWIASIAGWGLIAAGIAVAQWDEYAVALVLFVSGSVTLFLKAYHWQTERKVVRAMLTICAVGAIVASWPITVAKKGDKPWSDTLAHLASKVKPTAATISEPVVHIEPENGPLWSTGKGQTHGQFKLTFSNTGLEDIDYITVTEDYFVALKFAAGLVMKNLGGIPVDSHVCSVLPSKVGHCDIFLDFTLNLDVMNEVAKNNGVPYLRGVRLRIAYRRTADGKDYKITRGYGVIGPQAEGLLFPGDQGDPARFKCAIKL
jgi:hypothetical protein